MLEILNCQLGVSWSLAHYIQIQFSTAADLSAEMWLLNSPPQRSDDKVSNIITSDHFTGNRKTFITKVNCEKYLKANAFCDSFSVILDFAVETRLWILSSAASMLRKLVSRNQIFSRFWLLLFLIIPCCSPRHNIILSLSLAVLSMSTQNKKIFKHQTQKHMM